MTNKISTLTYLLYIVCYETLVIGGCGYAVFGLGRSGWWFLLAVLMSGSAYKPSDWRKLWSAENELKPNQL